MVNKYQYGVRYERKALEILRADGYFATRTAGSHGIADIWAIKQGIIILLQVKATKNYDKYHKSTISQVKKEFNKLKLKSVPGMIISKQLWIFHDRKYNVFFMNR